MLYNNWSAYSVYKHWPETREVITHTIELWNKWIRLHVLLQQIQIQSIEHVSIVYTCNTYFVMHWSMLFIQEYLVNVLIQYHDQKRPVWLLYKYSIDHVCFRSVCRKYECLQYDHERTEESLITKSSQKEQLVCTHT